MIIIACVNWRDYEGQGRVYVERLRRGVARYLKRPHEFICLTDNLYTIPQGVNSALLPAGLKTWWNKMAVFRPEWRRGRRVVYLDLDTVPVGDLEPLAALDVDFGICENFTRLTGNATWPCAYGSCVMTMAADFDQRGDVWSTFLGDVQRFTQIRGGDQAVIEAIVNPEAVTLLQRVLPKGFFLGYRELAEVRPPEAALVVFAGRAKPHNTTVEWVRNEWTR